jgi:peptidoglycan hydrolase-like protein with peptidoglycan-binding domain
LRQGNKGNEVEELQKLLMKHGYDLPRYGADGDFGNETLAAVKAFQADKGLEVDGAVGPITWAALRSEAVKEPMYTVQIAGLTLANANEIIAKYGGTKEVEALAV